MNPSNTRPTLRRRVSVGGLVAGALLSASLGAVPSGAAPTPAWAGTSAYCKTIIAFPKNAPKTTNLKSYQQWARHWLPYWQKAASQAPTSQIKGTLSNLVAILKAEANYKSEAALGAYIATHEGQWASGWSAFVRSLIKCEVPNF